MTAREVVLGALEGLEVAPEGLVAWEAPLGSR
jgi:hypothetical protein